MAGSADRMIPLRSRVLRDWRSGPDDHLGVHTRCRAFVSARIHPFGLDHRGGGGSRQVGNERLSGCRFCGVRRDGGREHDFLLQFGGERTDHIQTGPTAWKLRPDLIGNVETYPSFPFRI
jgi:hypothetical protein